WTYDTHTGRSRTRNRASNTSHSNASELRGFCELVHRDLRGGPCVRLARISSRRCTITCCQSGRVQRQLDTVPGGAFLVLPLGHFRGQEPGQGHNVALSDTQTVAPYGPAGRVVLPVFPLRFLDHTEPFRERRV